MRVRHALGVGIALAALAAGPARAATPELSVGDRLEDRRAVAAGTRAQVLGFEDGRFYANGWHITGEMGGIVTPPLKLLDSLYFGVNGEWAGQATRFTSGWGYTRAEFPAIGAFRLERTDFVPDGRRGALLGLKLTNTSGRTQAARVRVDAHSELMGQYPWGFTGTVPNASDNIPDTGAFDGATLEFRDTGSIGGVAHALHRGRRLEPHAARRAHGRRLLRALRRRPHLRRGPDAGADAERMRRRPVRPRHRRPAALPRARPPRRLGHDLDRRRRLRQLARRGPRGAPTADRKPRGPAAGEDRPARRARAQHAAQPPR